MGSEMCIRDRLINNMPDYKLGYAIAYLQGLVADESADDLYCAGLLDEYKNDTEKDDVVSFEEAAKMCGVDIDEIQD